MTSATASNANQPPRRLNILCVDDSPEMLLICRTILEASGFQVLTASDGRMALEVMERYAVDAAVIDNRMPGMSGIELARQIKQAHHDVLVLLFSDSGPGASCAAVDLFVSKERGPRAMRNAVRSLLERHSI
jgi:CheY-like chemotaxis protein